MARSSKTQNVRAAGSALDMLVRQFAQPLACLRELVQNSIDAGTNLIEVSLTRDKESNCLKLTVSDTGEGMTEEIIQTQLTRLFSSSKENDLTKVGKFGIGFVSVFALEPEAVVVDTARAGQSWRVLFHQDRKFDLIALPYSVDGTTVSLYLSEKRHKLPELQKSIEETLTFWCRHCRVDIRVNGKSLQKAFSLEAPLQVSHEEPGTRLVLAPTPEKKGFFGFYNQGLTLLEGLDSPVPHLTFKLDSRYFEHTLTRDNVIRNHDFDKAMALLQRIAREQLPAKLQAQLQAEGFDQPELWALIDVLPSLGVPPQWEHQAPLFPDHQGVKHSLAALKGHEVLFQEQSDCLTQAAHSPENKRTVLKLTAGHPAQKWLEGRIKLQPLLEVYGFCQQHDKPLPQDLLDAFGKLGPILGLGLPVGVRWLHHKGEAPLLMRAPIGLVGYLQEPPPRSPTLLNLGHSSWTSLLPLSRWSPALACQVMLQQYLLHYPEAQRESLIHKLTEGVLRQLS